jgi:predicted nucleic acid-binding protein
VRRRVLLDTGPLVAFLNARDHFHEWAKRRLAEIEPPALTCEAVIAEASHLLRSTNGGAEAVLGLLDSGLVVVPFRLDDEVEPLRRLLARYRDLPVSLADACLVRLAELERNPLVLTLDADFRVYRIHGRQAIPFWMPERGWELN